MQSMGKRMSTRQEYEIGVDDEGVIQYLDSKHWANSGCSFNEPIGFMTLHHMLRYVMQTLQYNKQL